MDTVENDVQTARENAALSLIALHRERLAGVGDAIPAHTPHANIRNKEDFVIREADMRKKDIGTPIPRVCCCVTKQRQTQTGDL